MQALAGGLCQWTAHGTCGHFGSGVTIGLQNLEFFDEDS